MLPHDLLSFIELAKLKSAVTGIFAGFALAIVVLLIERQADRSNRSSEGKPHLILGTASIQIFVVAFLVSTFASYLFAFSGAERIESARASFLIMPPAFLFALSAVLLTLGLALVLQSYNLEGVSDISQVVVFAAVFIALFYCSYLAGLVTAIMYGVSSANLFSRTEFLLSLCIASVGGPIIGIVIRWQRHRAGNTSFDQRGFRAFIYACIATSGLMCLPMIIVSNASPNLFVPFFLILFFVVVLSLLAGWAILYVPNSARL
jgi:drug/metabolite transporter (DMT)-like permease